MLLIHWGIVAFAAEPTARIQGLLLNAEEMFRDTESETVELSGKVQIVSQDRHIQADKARVSLRSRQIFLEGNVRLTTPTATTGGDKIVLDYESGTGIIYNGFVQAGLVRFEGSVIQKTGPEEYYVADANYTACTNCPPSWSFSGSTIRADIGGYAYIKNSVLRVGALPIFWFPYLVVPLKSDRQSGFLTPGFSQSKEGGLAISQPYFWVLSRSTDMTVTAKNYELRGPQALFNYRYVLGESSGGDFDTGILADRVFRNNSRLNRFRPPSSQGDYLNRYFVRYNHYEDFENGWIHRVSLQQVSDLQYPQDFANETIENGGPDFLNNGGPALENRVSITKNTHESHFSVDSSYYRNLLQGNPLAGNEDAVHRLPEVRFAQIPQSIGHTGFYYSLDLDYTNFTREGPAYDRLFYSTDQFGKAVRFVDNTCRAQPNAAYRYGSDQNCRRIDGPYNANTDVLRTGQRLEMIPTLSRPISLGTSADLLPKISYRETRYSFPAGDQQNDVRRYARIELEGRTNFSRVYGDLYDVKGTRYRHEMRPEIRYTKIPWIDYQKHPFFGFNNTTEAPTFQNFTISDADLAGNSGLQFDFQDRIYDRNLVTYSFVNTVTEKKWSGDIPTYNQIALFKISQSYDAWIDSTNSPDKEPWSNINLKTDLRFDHFGTYSEVDYYPYQKVTNSSSIVRVHDDLGRFIQVGYLKQFIIVPGQPTDISTRVEETTFTSGFISRYMNLMGRLTYNGVSNGDRIKSWAGIVQFKPPGDCWLISLIHSHTVGGDTNTSAAFDFTFDGVPKPPMSPDTLSNFGF